MAGKYRSLGNYGKIGQGDHFKHLEDVQDMDLLITSFVLCEGDFGPYVLAQAMTIEGEKLTIMTGAGLIVDALVATANQNALPVIAKFIHPKKAWLAVEADNPEAFDEYISTNKDI